MSNSCSNCSSDLAEADPYAPIPISRAWSSSGIVHNNDSGRRVATKTNVSSSASPGANLVQSSVASGCGSPPVARFLRTSTGANSNHSPKALQKGRLLGKTANFVRDDDGWRDSRRGINEGGGQMKQRSEQRSQQFREVYLAKQEDASATAPDSFRRGDIRGRCRGYA